MPKKMICSIPSNFFPSLVTWHFLPISQLQQRPTQLLGVKTTVLPSSRYSCCITGKWNTLAGKYYLPTYLYIAYLHPKHGLLWYHRDSNAQSHNVRSCLTGEKNNIKKRLKPTVKYETGCTLVTLKALLVLVVYEVC